MALMAPKCVYLVFEYAEWQEVTDRPRLEAYSEIVQAIERAIYLNQSTGRAPNYSSDVRYVVASVPLGRDRHVDDCEFMSLLQVELDYDPIAERVKEKLEANRRRVNG